MTARPPRSAMLHALTVKARPPREYDRLGRVALIGECAEALRDRRLPSEEAALFVGGALVAWLAHGNGGGDLATRFLRVVKRHSRHTPQVLWRLILDERHAAQGVRTIAPTTDDEASK